MIIDSDLGAAFVKRLGWDLQDYFAHHSRRICLARGGHVRERTGSAGEPRRPTYVSQFSYRTRHNRVTFR